MIVKAIRGSIWWYNFGKVVNNTHVQKGTRPCIVISNDKANAHAPIVTVCPLTTKQDNIPNRAKFYLNGRECYLLTEQITTIDFKDLYDYQGVVDKTSMRYVDLAILSQLGLITTSDDDVLALMQSIYTMLDKLEHLKENEVKHQVEKDSQIKQSLGKIQSQLTKYSGMTAVEKFNAKYSKPESVEAEIDKSQRKNRKWTSELKDELLNDVEELSRTELVKKMGI